MADFPVAANADDIMRSSAGAWTDTTYSYVGHQGAPPVPAYETLLRVQLVASIPVGSTINSAVVAFESLGGSGTLSIPIYALNYQSCSAFPLEYAPVLMEEFVTWEQAALPSGETYTTPDISAVVQEWLDGFGGHADTDYFGLTVKGTGGVGQNIVAVGTKNGAQPPVLSITWTPPAAGGIARVAMGPTLGRRLIL